MAKKACGNVCVSDYDELYRQELEELNTSYTDDEIVLHLHHREWKSVMEMIHAHNWQLIMLCLEWREYLAGRAKRPVKKICKYVNPSQSADINNACFFINSLISLMCKYGEGNCPQTRINTYCSRSTATLIEKLGQIKQSKHLTRAECACSRIFKFATYSGDPTMHKEEYEKTLHHLAETFVVECTANAEELSEFTAQAVSEIEGEASASIYRRNNKPISVDEAKKLLKNESAELKAAIVSDGDTTRKDISKSTELLSEMNKTVETINARDKRYRRRSKAHFTIQQQDGIYNEWMAAKIDPCVKAISKHKSNYEAAIIQHRKGFEANGAHTANDIRLALRSRSNRLNRKQNLAQE